MQINRRNLLKYAAAGGVASMMNPAYAQQQQPFRIGVLCDQSSVNSTSGGKGSITAIQLAVEDFGGQVLGRPIEVLTADHQNKVEIASGIAREWMETKNVEAFFDLQNSACALAVMGLASAKNKVAVVSNAHSSQLTGKQCTPTSFHWTYDTYQLSGVQPQAFVGMGKKRWFLLNWDYAFGISLEQDFRRSLEALGAEVVGSVRVPAGASDFSSAILAAANSGADVVQVGVAGTDLLNLIKSAREFGLDSAATLATTSITLVDVELLGLEAAQGLYVNEVFYWDQNEKTRAWSKRYIDKVGIPPNGERACGYSGALHYLKAVAKTDGADGAAVAREMRNTPVNDLLSDNLTVRSDGLCVRDMYLYKVKSPSASKTKFDDYEYVSKVTGESSVRPLSVSECPLVKT